MASPDLSDAPIDLLVSPSAPSRWQRIRQILKRIGLALGAGLLVWQIWRAVGQISATGVSLPSGWAMGAALLLAMLSHLAQMAAWRELMAGLGTRLPWRRVIEGFMLSMLPRYIPGTVWGYLSRGQWLYEQFGVPFRNSSISSILELGLTVLSGLVFVAAAYFHSLLAGLAVIVVSCLGYALLTYVARKEFMAGRFPVMPLDIFLKSFVLCGLIWPLYGLIIACLLAISAGLWRTLIDFGYAFFFAWISGLLAFFIPSGLGVREFALQTVLQYDGLTGSIIIVAPLLVRLATIISEIAWLCVGLGLKRRG